MVTEAKRMRIGEDFSEQHQEIITVYDESQLGQPLQEINNSTESNVQYLGRIQHEEAPPESNR